VGWCGAVGAARGAAGTGGRELLLGAAGAVAENVATNDTATPAAVDSAAAGLGYANVFCDVE